MTLSRTRRTWAGLLLVAGLPASVSPLRAQSIAEVQVTPETMTLGVNQRQTLFAAAYDRQGNLVPSAKFLYWSSDTLIARVQRDGTVVGVAPGLAKVEARVQGRSASMAVLITGRPADSITVPPGSVMALEPGTLILLPGESAPISAQALREDRTPLSVGRISWKSAAPEVAGVDSNGVVVGVGPGETIVEASAAGLSAGAPVTVQPAEFAVAPARVTLGPAESDTLRAIVPAQGNRELRAGVSYLSTDTTVVQVGPGGVVSARAPGQAAIVASGYAQERRVEVVVHRPVQALVVSPPAGDLRLPARATLDVSVIAEGADSTPIPEARLAWTVGDTSLVAYDPSARRLMAKAEGTTTLTARLAGFDPVVWTVTVIPGLLGLDRRRLGLAVGERDSVVASLVDESGKAVAPATGLKWVSDRPDVARVSGDGTIDGLGPGRATVTAQAPWGKSAAVDVFVTSDLVVSSNRSGSFGIHQLRAAAGESLHPVLTDSGATVQAVLSPDRTRIAFSSNRHGSYDLFVADADGSAPVRLTHEPGNEGDPVWTPDGARLIYTSTPAGKLPELHAVGADGRDRRPVAVTAGGAQMADVSPDGRRVAFVSAREGSQDIYLLDLAGGEPRRVTSTGARESHPHFMPNGDLVYAETGGRSRGSRVLRLPEGAAEPALLFRTEQPVLSLDVSRDGARLAYVTGKLTDAERGKGQFSLFVRSFGGEPEPIPLRPGEQVVSPAF